MIAVFERCRQADWEYKASLGYVSSSRSVYYRIPVASKQADTEHASHMQGPSSAASTLESTSGDMSL